ncbi:MAG: HAD family phosphatase [Nanoarchaeota archaeon]
MTSALLEPYWMYEAFPEPAPKPSRTRKVLLHLAPPSSLEAVIFDLDGLIVDTEEIGVRVSAGLIQKEFGIELSAEDRRGFYGVPDLDYYDQLIRKYALQTSAEELLRKYNPDYDQHLLDIKNPLPGLLSVVGQGIENGFKMGICSGSFEHQITQVLSNLCLLSCFDAITSYEDTKRHKPHPDPYLLTAKKLGVVPNKCLVFEDSESGVLSARRAGMYVVGVQIGNHGTQDLRLADQVVYSLEGFTL